jgi:hypothetical protein
VLDGKYEILNRIGGGGMGEVFKARHLHLDAPRCIKVMRQTLMADDTFKMRFLREARLATQIHHPNIAVVHDFFVGDGGSYMVSEFIDGTTVRQWCAQNGPFPLAIADAGKRNRAATCPHCPRRPRASHPRHHPHERRSNRVHRGCRLRRPPLARI